MNHKTLDDRRALCAQPHVTLNGQPAVVCGAQNDFATVAVVPYGESYTWAWATAAHIIADKSGRFHS